jgi:4-carboxymuconolactone decarboxylase
LSDSRFDSEPDTRADLRFEPATDRPPEAPLSSSPDARWQQGMAIRRSVLGDAHVDRTERDMTDFDRDFQRYITRAAWGELWTRPGLPLPTRHLLTIVMLAVLGREEELELHLRATRNTGVTPDEVKEALMHVAVYAGVPAANAAMKLARRVLFSREPTDSIEPGESSE